MSTRQVPDITFFFLTIHSSPLINVDEYYYTGNVIACIDQSQVNKFKSTKKQKRYNRSCFLISYKTNYLAKFATLTYCLAGPPTL